MGTAYAHAWNIGTGRDWRCWWAVGLSGKNEVARYGPFDTRKRADAYIVDHQYRFAGLRTTEVVVQYESR